MLYPYPRVMDTNFIPRLKKLVESNRLPAVQGMVCFNVEVGSASSMTLWMDTDWRLFPSYIPDPDYPSTIGCLMSALRQLSGQKFMFAAQHDGQEWAVYTSCDNGVVAETMPYAVGIGEVGAILAGLCRALEINP